MSVRRRPPSARATVGCVVALALGAVGVTGCARSAGDDAGARPARTAPSIAPAASVPSSSAASPAPMAIDARYAVGVRTETYVDVSRPTSAVGRYPGAPNRTFPVTVWYPATGEPGVVPQADAPLARAGGPFPLVLFAHGYAVTPDFYDALLGRWAAAGYVVAAPTYPLLSGVPAGPSHQDYLEVFADTEFVLSRVLADYARATSAHPFAGAVDSARVATAGQSDGEIPAFGLGFLVCCANPQVRSVVAMAGNLGNLNNPVRRDTGIPVLHIMGDADELQPYPDAIAWDRANLTAPRWLLTLRGGSHAAPYRSPDDALFAGVVETTVAFLDGTLKGHPERLAAIDEYAAAHGDRFRLER